jgi:hypothetical protein
VAHRAERRRAEARPHADAPPLEDDVEEVPLPGVACRAAVEAGDVLGRGGEGEAVVVDLREHAVAGAARRHRRDVRRELGVVG